MAIHTFWESRNEMMSLEPISSLSFTCASIASATSPSSTWSALRASLFTCFDKFYNLDYVQENFCSSKRLLDTVSSFQSNSARTTPLDKIWEWIMDIHLKSYPAQGLHLRFNNELTKFLSVFIGMLDNPDQLQNWPLEDRA